MPQIFRPSTNTLARASIFGAVFFLGGVLALLAKLDRTGYNTRQGTVIQQPVPFSHDHHVSQIGIDCRYCHNSVERTASAGMPASSTCLNCHSQIWKDAPMLEPVRASAKSGTPIRWTRVHDLPDFVYFNHSIHVAKGVGCTTCHGPVGKMPLMYQQNSLQMNWCLECHRNPEKFVRPRSEVFNVDWQPPANQEELGRQLVAEYKVLDARHLTSCSTCHR
jgi:Cytochrome c7 and related cytochrome c